MQRVELRKLAASSQQYADQQLTVAGWVRTIRTSKSLGFIELNDGTCFQNLQVVFEEGKVNNFNEVGKLNVGASIIVTGTLILTPEAKQPYEIHAATIEVELHTRLSAAEKAPLDGVLAHHRTPAPQNQHLQRGVPCPFRSGFRHPQIL